MSGSRVAVVGAGWAGLAAAVALCDRGHPVTVFELAGQAGGRARRVDLAGMVLDNGQHILIGAYGATLGLMRRLGVDEGAVLHRQPLVLRYPDGRGLSLPAGAAIPAFVRGVAGASGWPLRDRLGLLAAAGGWMLRRFRCDPSWTVARLCRRLPASIRADLIEPLCVAALNTPAEAASAEVFLRVLRDALFGGRGGADLLLPRQSLSALLPDPAWAALAQGGAVLHLGARVSALSRDRGAWRIGEERFRHVVLACGAAEAGRLTQAHAPGWSRRAAALHYEPIVTVYVDAPGARLPLPMVALDSGVDAPAQFVFDLGALGGAPGRLACAVSGAAGWVERGLAATADATLRQLRQAFPPATWSTPPTVLRALAEKRATFRCTPGLDRPPGGITDGLWAAGDYVQGPYPATLEGAVRSGQQAAASIGDD